MKKFDVMIVGGGMVGCTLALALAKDTSLSIAIIESATETTPWQSMPYHHRVSAISLASKRIFSALDVWEDIKAMRISPFMRMNVWDGLSAHGEIEFDSQTIAESALGYIVENNAIQTALLAKLKQHSGIHYLSGVNLSDLCESEEAITLKTKAHHTFSAKIAVAADGANSWLRQAAHIDLNKEDYQQRAIVSTVHTSLPHEKVARQIFLPTGPLAFLPLQSPTTSSIVWSVPVHEASRLFALEKSDFMMELGHAFQHRLGTITAIEERHVFPLYKQQATHYVKSRIVLVGDAAHTMHPLAGQGVNVGLLDAASLAEVISDAINRHRDFSSAINLRRYERWRRSDNLTLLAGVDLIKQLFANDKKPIQQLRALGLRMTNKLPWLKNQFIRQAVGLRGNLPKIAGA